MSEKEVEQLSARLFRVIARIGEITNAVEARRKAGERVAFTEAEAAEVDRLNQEIQALNTEIDRLLAQAKAQKRREDSVLGTLRRFKV